MRSLLLMLAATVPLLLLGCEPVQDEPCDPCPTVDCDAAVPTESTYWVDANSPIVLPGDKRWHLTVLVHDDYRSRQLDRLFMSWLHTDPVLRGLMSQAVTRFYQPKDDFYAKWKPFTKGQLPAICLQDPAGNRVYTAIYDGTVQWKSGSPIVPIPASPAMLAADIRAAVASWEGFVDLAAPAAGTGDTPAYEIDQAGRLFFRNRCTPQPSPSPSPDVTPEPDVTITDLDRMFSGNRVEVNPRPAARAWSLPAWVPILCGAVGLLLAIGIGVMRRIQSESQS